MLSEVWDRWRDRPRWASQQALRNLREQADVVLYLVNAAEEPAAAAYVAPEMQLLAWVGKPVLVLLNQLGAPRESAAELTDVQRWRSSLAPFALVQAVLPLDAFARCWVQEAGLLRAIEHALPAPQQGAARRLAQALSVQHQATFEAAMAVLANSLARTALARQTIEGGGAWLDRLRRAGARVGLPGGNDDAVQRAQRALAAAAQMVSGLQQAHLHGLERRAGLGEQATEIAKTVGFILQIERLAVAGQHTPILHGDVLGTKEQFGRARRQRIARVVQQPPDDGLHHQVYEQRRHADAATTKQAQQPRLQRVGCQQTITKGQQMAVVEVCIGIANLLQLAVCYGA